MAFGRSEVRQLQNNVVLACCQGLFSFAHSWLDICFLRGPFNGTLQVSHRTARVQPQFALLTYIVRGTAYLNLDSVSDEVF